MQNINKWISLVEIMVSLWILILLGTIALYYFNWYIISARDSKRIIEIDNLITSIESYQLKDWRLPFPDDSVDITYSWAKVWEQWILWENVINILGYSKEDVLDPNEISHYTYSVKNNRKEYSIAWALEWDNTIPTTDVIWSSTWWLKTWNAVVMWNYNWALTHVNTWWIDYILAVPSIVTTDLSSTDLINVLDEKNLVFDWQQNLPASYNLSKLSVDNDLDFSPDNLVIFTWSLSSLYNEEERMSLLYVLQKSYSWTTVNDESFLWSVINNDIDVIYPDKQDLDLSCDLVNKKLNYKIDCDYINFSSFYVIDEPVELWDIDFWILENLQVNYIYQEWNNLWFWTSDWAYSYDVTTWVWSTYEELSEFKITVIIKDNEWAVWFWTSDSWLVMLNDEGDFINYQSDYDPVHVNNNHFTPTSTNWIPSNAIYDIVMESSWNLIIWTHNGWSYYDQNTETFEDFYVVTWKKHYLYSQNRLKNFLIDHDDNLWLWTDRWAYLFQWDITQTPNWWLYTFDWWNWLPKEWNNSKLRVNVIFEDSYYNMWFGTDEWIWKLDSNLYPDEIYNVRSGEWLANNDIKSIFEDLDDDTPINDMWFWTNVWVSVLSDSTSKFTNYTKDVEWANLWTVFYIYQDENWLNILWTENWSTTIE